MPDILSSVALGLETALSGTNLFYCALGVVLGMVVGIIPGIGALAAISLLFPLTFYLEPTASLIMLAGIYYGSGYGGSIAAILLNIPGTPSSAVACLDGYPMARQGRAGVALLLTTLSSFFAGSIGIIAMMLFSPLIVQVAIGFGSVEFVSLIVLGLVAASTISGDSPAKGLAGIALGISAGIVGMDMYTGVPRFTFGSLHLFEGFGLIAVAMGLFGVSEMVTSIKRQQEAPEVFKVSWRSMLPTRDDWRRTPLPALRGALIGLLCGILPGTGAILASFMGYTVEKKLAKDPSRFGKGAVEGIVSSEGANNAAEQASFIPTMTLGIPGSATMALMMGVLIINGITPGPSLMVDQPSLFWGLIMSFWIGNLLLLVLNIPLIGLWVRMLQIPYHYIYPAVLLFICVGVYSIGLKIEDVWLVLAFGLAGYFLHQIGIPVAPLILGFVLGPLLEEHFRRALLLSDGSLSTFIESPFSAVVLAISLLIVLWGVFRSILKPRQKVVAV